MYARDYDWAAAELREFPMLCDKWRLARVRHNSVGSVT